MARRRRRWLWLLAAAVLLAAGAWLMRGAEPPEREHGPPVNIPTRMTAVERRRNEERATWLPPVTVTDAGQLLSPPPRPRDPVLAALPPKVERAAVVVEANAIRNSELGELLVQCLFEGEDDFLGRLRDAGLDPLVQVDRVGVFDDTVMVSGDFKATRWKELLGTATATATGYGRQGELLALPGRDGGVQAHLATWGGQLLLVGDDPEALKQALDRLDGTGPQRPGVLSESQAWGEVYGVVNGGALADVVGQEDEKLARVLREAAKTVELHVDVGRDVGLSADVGGDDPAKAEELRRALGSALALARAQAQARGRTDEADVLDLARVHAAEGGASFRLEAGLPHDFIAKSLKKCVEERRARRRK